MAVIRNLLALLVLVAWTEAALKDVASAKGKYIGTAVDDAPLAQNEAQYVQILGSEFNFVTPGNAMKFDATEPSQGQFNFANADRIVDFAIAHGEKVRGHTFVWHQQYPAWLNNLDSNQLSAALQNHILTEGQHYAGKVYSWDVCNEVFDDNGQLRQDLWLQKLGEGYIAQAFQWAKQADPNAKLYINDYNTEDVNAKSDALYNLVKTLKAQGVPIEGVGFQAHFVVEYGVPQRLQENLQRFADLGVEVAITELDLRMNMPATQENLQKQAQQYQQVVAACVAVPKCVGVSIWGFTDKYSWVPQTFPGTGSALIYDEQYQQKLSYGGVVSGFGGAFSNRTSNH